MTDAEAVQAEAPVEIVEVPAVEAVADVAEVVEAVEVPLTPEERVEVGSVLERTARGWSARLHYGGAVRLFGEGQTIAEALASAGVE